MNTLLRRFLAILFVTLLVAIPTLAVFAKELGPLTITGPGIKGQLTVDDRGGLTKLQQTGFFDTTAKIKPPQSLGEGYNVSASLNLDGKLVPFLEMVYYPVAKGKPGYIHYTGRLNGQTMQSVDEWQVLPLDADDAFRGLMDEYGVRLQSAVSIPPAPQAATASSIASLPPQIAYTILGVAILALAGIGFILRRRALKRRSV